MKLKEFIKYHEGKSQAYSLFKELQKSETEFFFFKNLSEAIELRIKELTKLQSLGEDSNNTLDRRIKDLEYLKNALDRRLHLDIFS